MASNLPDMKHAPLPTKRHEMFCTRRDFPVPDAPEMRTTSLVLLAIAAPATLLAVSVARSNACMIV
eukprot:CAMPEP_0113593774 /NCGR_PEP_ID=MMETSP0015_2-20120614/38654_1 /TAXON_ID=2838 /ORGANISM="Odontella" /LENGTH=65 /DNA_ID=CAMNT_0000500589 /DNA_START=182 /DNA_END=376 /DNA_ORIENTATION=- /assembly_acc=CAM_ASM_000160